MVTSMGVIGTGRIGSPMAANLLASGYGVNVYDARSEAMATPVRAGARPMANPREVAQASDIVFLSLTTGDIVERVLFGADGVCADDNPGKIVIDTSTIQPAMAQAFAARVAAAGGAYLDAPVTGGEHGAQAGTLSIMVGGDDAAFQAAQDALRVVGGTITRIGPSGAGQVAKMVNQMIMAGYFVAIAEGFSFAEQLGADVEKIFQAIEGGGARSGLLSGFGANYLRAQGEASSAAVPPHDDHYGELFAKDLHYALEEGHAHRLHMPVTATAHEIAKRMLRQPLRVPFPLRLLDVWRD